MEEKIGLLIRAIAAMGAVLHPARVIRVDEAKALCDVKLIQNDENDKDNEFKGFNLLSADDDKNEGLLLIPAKDSVVMVNMEMRLVITFSQLSKILITVPDLIINNGENGPVIILERLETEIKKLNDAIKSLKNATSTALKTLDLAVPATSAVAFDTATSSIQEADLSKVGNEHFKH